MKTVKELRQAGYKVYVQHKRREILKRNGRSASATFVTSPKGGETIVTIQDALDTILATGQAKCSKKDSYNRKLGLTIALGRALKNSSL